MIGLAASFLGATAYGELLAGASASSIERLIGLVLQRGAIFVVEVDGGALIGMLALVVVPHPISGERYADELCWWVEPRYRRTRLGPLLLEVAEAWARQNGASMLKMVAPAGTDVGRFYERVGYAAVETAYQKRL